MQSPPELPLPTEELPQGIRKFGSPESPTPARTMGAKGLVPVKGNDLVTLLLQLAADPDENVAQAAEQTFQGLPEAVVYGACEAALHPAVLDALANRLADDADAMERIIRNRDTPDATIARIAARCDESTSELIAVNQQRLLGAPEIIEALYKNRNTRMSTADRLVELAARNGVELDLPAFKAHAEAIKGQLIPEPTDEPLPSDTAFQEALDMDAEDPEAIERDKVDGNEELKDTFKPLNHRIREMSVGEKIRMTVIGDAAARAILVRDPNKTVARAAINSPRMKENEVVSITHSKEIDDDILRIIGNRKEWIRNYEVKRALVFNPKTPAGVSQRFLPHLRDNDLKTLSRSRNVPAALRNTARQRIQMKQRKG